MLYTYIQRLIQIQRNHIHDKQRNFNCILLPDGKPTFWCFLLRQLMDPSKREIVAWTGRGREFR